MKYQFRLNDKGVDTIVEVDATRRGDTILVTLPDGNTRELAVLKNEGGKITLKEGDRQINLVTHRDGSKRQLWVGGGGQAPRTVVYERVEHGASLSGIETAGSLSASIPAVVTDVLVVVGDGVSAGEKLILLESMKMVIPIVATQDGVVKEIKCETGESVQPGVPLIELE